MSNRVHGRALILAVALSGTAVVWAGVPGAIMRRGWQPMQALVGASDPATAIPSIKKGTEAFGVVLHGLTIDAPTQEFLAELRGSLASFDLEGFHEMLPDQRGPWRSIRIAGRREGKAYTVRKDGSKRVDPFGPVPPKGKRLSDLQGELRARPAPVRGERTNYVLQAQLGLGIGDSGWEHFTGMLASFAGLAASADPSNPRMVRDMTQRPGKATRLKLLTVRPRLRAEDIELLGMMWEAYPRMGDVLFTVGRIEDVLVFDPKGDGGFQQIRLTSRLRPDLLEERHPELAGFLKGIGPLVNLQMAWVDELGRQLARTSLDSKELRFTLECFLKDGRLLPVDKRGKVMTTAPVYPKGAARKIRALTTVRFNMNGIRLTMQGMRMDWTYATQPGKTDLTCSITKQPKVSISGRAFGILPTWAIDVMIPGNIDELMRAFMRTACTGNAKQGIAIGIHTRQIDGAGTLTLRGGMEVLNSLLVRIAMQIASKKLLPSADVRSDIHALLVRLHAAFQDDLTQFGVLVKPKR